MKPKLGQETNNNNVSPILFSKFVICWYVVNLPAFFLITITFAIVMLVMSYGLMEGLGP